MSGLARCCRPIAPRRAHLAKAVQGDPFEQLAGLHGAALQAAILELLKKLPTSAWTKAVVAALQAGDLAALYAALQEAPFKPGDYETLTTAVTSALQAGAGLAAPELPPIAMRLAPAVSVAIATGRLQASLDLSNPATARFLRQYQAGLIRHVEDTTRETVRTLVDQGIKQGENPRVTAQAVKRTVGLTPGQAKAVANFRKELETWHERRGAKDWNLGGKVSRAPGGRQVFAVDQEGNPLDAIEARRLRDFRYDKLLQNALGSGTPIPKEKIDEMVARYSERMLARRAETISRSEAIRALNAGKLRAWEQQVEAGNIPAHLVFNKWIVGAQERLCPYCRGIARHYNAMNNGFGVPLGGTFDPSVLDGKGIKPSGIKALQQAALEGDPTALKHPPLHPNCRCTLVTRLVEPEMLA